jgi:hypothetical protein
MMLMLILVVLFGLGLVVGLGMFLLVLSSRGICEEEIHEKADPWFWLFLLCLLVFPILLMVYAKQSGFMLYLP